MLYARSTPWLNIESLVGLRQRLFCKPVCSSDVLLGCYW